MSVLMRCESIVCFSVLIGGCAPQDAVIPRTSVVKTTQKAFNAASAPTIHFSLPDMMCAEGCGVKTKEILSKQPGVKDVLVDFDTKSASVAIEEGKFDSGAAIAALVDHGFEQSSLKGEGGGIAKPQAAPAE